jgi:hypothetical protein
MSVGHESEWRKGLPLGDFSDVVAQLLVGFARIAAAALGLNHGEDLAARLVEAVVGDAVWETLDNSPGRVRGGGRAQSCRPTPLPGLTNKMQSIA